MTSVFVNIMNSILYQEATRIPSGHAKFFHKSEHRQL